MQLHIVGPKIPGKSIQYNTKLSNKLLTLLTLFTLFTYFIIHNKMYVELIKNLCCYRIIDIRYHTYYIYAKTPKNNLRPF